MDELVARLSTGDHPIEIGVRPDRTAQAFKDCIDRGYVHIKFTGTRGGTELGVRLDQQATELADADFSSANGRVKVVGDLTLNDIPVKCLAEVDLSTLSGTGRLQPIER